MKITDLSGEIKEGIWKYGDMYPDFKPRHIQAGDNIYFCEVFDGMSSHTGTYLETVAHFNGYKNQPLIEDVALERLYNIPCHVVKLKVNRSKTQRTKITADDFKKAINVMKKIEKGDAILFCCEYNEWYKEGFLELSPYITREAMEYLMSFEPSILGSDIPAWEKDEGVFDIYSKTNTLMIAPLINLDTVNEYGKLTVLPIKISGTCCVPARAVFIEE